MPFHATILKYTTPRPMKKVGISERSMTVDRFLRLRHELSLFIAVYGERPEGLAISDSAHAGGGEQDGQSIFRLLPSGGRIAGVAVSGGAASSAADAGAPSAGGGGSPGSRAEPAARSGRTRRRQTGSAGAGSRFRSTQAGGRSRYRASSVTSDGCRRNGGADLAGRHANAGPTGRFPALFPISWIGAPR